MGKTRTTSSLDIKRGIANRLLRTGRPVKETSSRVVRVARVLWRAIREAFSLEASLDVRLALSGLLWAIAAERLRDRQGIAVGDLDRDEMLEMVRHAEVDRDLRELAAALEGEGSDTATKPAPFRMEDLQAVATALEGQEAAE